MVSYRASAIALLSSCFAFASEENRRFSERDELKDAVEQYIEDVACIYSTDGNGCDVGQTYGWPMNTWDVSNVTGMWFLFWHRFESNLFRSFNEDISDWNVSQVTDMGGIFFTARSFNGNLSRWDTSKVTNMSYMFTGATSFNSDLALWDVSKVTYMVDMFRSATSFNQDLCAWQDKFFTYSYYDNMFGNSGCMFQNNPNEQEGGPFCASSCNDGATTVTLNNAVTVVAASLIFVQNML
mmetsp:Transcript_10212/g.22126  ORF Transcript_10212/g.22126 Transcript_10212/m.22126 type:complete len:239 (-) Transcript_10212:477-1193(-)